VSMVRGATRTQTFDKVPKPLALKSHIYLPEVPLETSCGWLNFVVAQGHTVPHYLPPPILGPATFLPERISAFVEVWINFANRALRAKGSR